MREDLVGYLLGAVDANERQRIERALAASVELRQELERIRHALLPLEALEHTQTPPPRLVEHTLARIDESCVTPASSAPLASPHRFSSAWAHALAPADCLVMGLAVLAVLTLLFPALVNSRFEARKLSCQDNLQVLGVQLTTFSNRRAGRVFPEVPTAGNRAFAGVYAPTLRDHLLLDRNTRRLVCAGAPLAVDRDTWYVPSLAEIDAAQGVRLKRLRQRAGGSYAYSIGYFDNGGYQAHRNLDRSFFALVADAPSSHLPGRLSANHAGIGQNICFEDGHVEFVRDPHVMRSDDPLRNRLGYAEAGVDRDDAVLLSSGMRPIVGNPLIPPPLAAADRSTDDLPPFVRQPNGR